VLETYPGQDGHHILPLTGLWGPLVDHLLKRMALTLASRPLRPRVSA
jgi:hypothetical protein